MAQPERAELHSNMHDVPVMFTCLTCTRGEFRKTRFLIKLELLLNRVFV